MKSFLSSAAIIAGLLLGTGFFIMLDFPVLFSFLLCFFITWALFIYPNYWKALKNDPRVSDPHLLKSNSGWMVRARNMFTQKETVLVEFHPSQVKYVSVVFKHLKGQPEENMLVFWDSFPDTKYVVDSSGLREKRSTAHRVAQVSVKTLKSHKKLAEVFTHLLVTLPALSEVDPSTFERVEDLPPIDVEVLDHA